MTDPPHIKEQFAVILERAPSETTGVFRVDVGTTGGYNNLTNGEWLLLRWVALVAPYPPRG